MRMLLAIFFCIISLASLARVSKIHQSVPALSANTNHLPTLCVSAGKQQEYTVITLRNHGKNLSSSLHHKIVQPFFTTKPTTAVGTGWGLSDDFVERSHQEKLWVDAVQGAYTSFNRYLK